MSDFSAYTTHTNIGRLKALLFIIALIPAARLIVLASTNSLGSDAIETFSRQTGLWAFNFLIFTLCITPLRKASGASWLLRLRRMLGLFTFFYAVLHVCGHIAHWAVDLQFSPSAIAGDIVKHPFALAGLAAFALMVPLALTSNNAAVRRLGGKRWQELHRNIYLIAILVAIHYLWRTWQIAPETLPYPLAYTIAIALLLGWRARERIRAYQVTSEFKQQGKPKEQVIRFFRQPPKT